MTHIRQEILCFSKGNGMAFNWLGLVWTNDPLINSRDRNSLNFNGFR